MRATYDLESTGTDPQHDRIIQVAVLLDDGTNYLTLVNPCRPIPPEVVEITGITDALVADAPVFKDIVPKLVDLLSGKTLVTFGGLRFDLPLLAEEFERCGINFTFGPMIDAGGIYKILEPRTLSEATRFYCGHLHDGAHQAMADAVATRAVLFAQLAKYPELAGKSDEELALFSNHGKRIADPAGRLALNDAGELVFNTYRNRGVRVVDEPGYANWMLDKMPAATCRMIRRELAMRDDEDAGWEDPQW